MIKVLVQSADQRYAPVLKEVKAHTRDYCLKHEINYLFVEPKEDVKGFWIKESALASLLPAYPDETHFVWLDLDAVISKRHFTHNIFEMFYSDFDISMVNTFPPAIKRYYYNAGVMFMRNRPRVRQFISNILARRPEGLEEEVVVNDELNKFDLGLKFSALPFHYNSWGTMKVKHAVINGFHGENWERQKEGGLGRKLDLIIQALK